MLQYVLPLEPNLQKLVHVFYTQPTFVLPYAKVRTNTFMVNIYMYTMGGGHQ